MTLGGVGGDPLRIDFWHVHSDAVILAVHTVKEGFSALLFTQLRVSSTTGPQRVQNYESLSYHFSPSLHLPPGSHLNTSFPMSLG